MVQMTATMISKQLKPSDTSRKFPNLRCLDSLAFRTNGLGRWYRLSRTWPSNLKKSAMVLMLVLHMNTGAVHLLVNYVSTASFKHGSAILSIQHLLSLAGLRPKEVTKAGFVVVH